MNDHPQNFFSRIKAFKRLPTLPHILVRLIEGCSDETTGIQELSQIIATDAGLTARVLYLANSSYYRNQEKVSLLDEALERLGRNAVKNLVFSAAVHQVLHQSHGMDAPHLKRFWRHSLLSAILARMIAVKTAYPEPEQAFFAGMVHDMGRLVLSANFPDAYAPLLDYAPHEFPKLLEEERKIGASHTEVGAWLLDQWNLDSLTVDAVLYHHEPASRIANAYPLVKIIYAANILSEMTESNDVSCEDVISLLSFDPDETADLIFRAEEKMESFAQSLGIDIGSKRLMTALEADSAAPHRELLNSVGNMAMLFGPLQDLTEAADEEGMLQTLLEGVRILFDTPAVLLFLHDRERQLLMNYGAPHAERLSLPLDLKAILPVRCHLTGEIISSFDQDSGTGEIIDEQLARILDRKGLICAPLMARTEKIGVVVVGVDEEGAADLRKGSRLLKLFTDVVAVAIHADRLKREPARLMQSEKLAAMTALMRRVAHEINNPLGIIKNYLTIMEAKLGEGHDAQKEIRVIREEIDSITRLLPELSDSYKR